MGDDHEDDVQNSCSVPMSVVTQQALGLVVAG